MTLGKRIAIWVAAKVPVATKTGTATIQVCHLPQNRRSSEKTTTRTTATRTTTKAVPHSRGGGDDDGAGGDDDDDADDDQYVDRHWFVFLTSLTVVTGVRTPMLTATTATQHGY
jgi:hypothetical protein